MSNLTTTQIMASRETLKEAISAAIDIPPNYISEFYSDGNVVVFVVLAEKKFSAIITDGVVDPFSLRVEDTYEPIEEIDF